MNTTPITVVLANRPRLFRELLQHALNTVSSRFRVVEAVDAMPSPALLGEADWVVVDEESSSDVASLTAAHPHLNILALERRGSRARILAANAPSGWESLAEVPTLSTLFDLLSNVPARQTR
jgi:hypothetical protein